MTMWIVSDDPRLRLFDGHADIAGAHHSRMMRTAPVGGVGANPISLSAQCGKGFLERGRPRFLSADPQAVGTVSVEHGGSAPVIPVMPRVAVCASTASMSAGFGTSGRIHSGLRGHIPADCLRMLSWPNR